LNEKSLARNWAEYGKWERAFKKQYLRKLTVRAAFKIFLQLWELQANLPQDELDALRRRKLEALTALRMRLSAHVKG
jgi:hypothetical protein